MLLHRIVRCMLLGSAPSCQLKQAVSADQAWDGCVRPVDGCQRWLQGAMHQHGVRGRASDAGAWEAQVRGQQWQLDDQYQLPAAL